MNWSINIHKRVQKKIDKLPLKVISNLNLLIKDIVFNGPVRGNWPNYSKLDDNFHHCHVKKGNPTYVVIWEVVDNEIKIVEIRYVGTHEKAPY